VGCPIQGCGHRVIGPWELEGHAAAKHPGWVARYELLRPTEPAPAGRVPSGAGPAGHLKPGVCRRSPPTCDRWHIRQPVPAATFTAVLPRGSSGDTGGARWNRQGDGDTAEDRCSGVRRPRGWSPGTGGVRSGRWRCRSGRGRPPPRPVGTSGQARSVTAGAGPGLPRTRHAHRPALPEPASMGRVPSGRGAGRLTGQASTRGPGHFLHPGGSTPP